jgi:hypothetical protein
MKVIHQGNNPATVPLQCTCGQCRSVIEFLPFEAKRTFDQREGDFYSITCPVCQFTITTDVRNTTSQYQNR